MDKSFRRLPIVDLTLNRRPRISVTLPAASRKHIVGSI